VLVQFPRNGITGKWLPHSDIPTSKTEIARLPPKVRPVTWHGGTLERKLAAHQADSVSCSLGKASPVAPDIMRLWNQLKNLLPFLSSCDGWELAAGHEGTYAVTSSDRKKKMRWVLRVVMD
jgi:hypothetical protein